jgi:osmotically-inducible protein OsmY
MSNHPLENAVMDALAANPCVHPDEIVAEALGDEVLLRGTVGSLIQRAEAVRTANAVPGVRLVDDMLHVRPLGVDGRADVDTEAAVMAELIADDGLSATDIDVDAHGGIVTLTGLVDLAAQRDRAERVALRVGGVTEVHNKLQVLLLVSADEVAERVTDAIGTDAIVGADRITVTVRDNDVTLTGTVRSTEHRVAAVTAAAGARGATDVHDELTVRAYP